MNNEELRDYLAHYGVLGMKWGKRKGRSSTVSVSKEQKIAEKNAKKKAKILKSPTKLYKNREKFSQAEIENAMKKMKMERELRSLSRDQISSGAQFAQSILAYGTAAVTAYGIYNSPPVQNAIKQIKK